MHSLDIFGIVFSTCSPDSCAKTSTVFPKGQFFWVTFHDHTIFPCDEHERRGDSTSTYFSPPLPHSEFGQLRAVGFHSWPLVAARGN